MPADLAAVEADDALLDFLGSGGVPGDPSDELTRVLAAWRREVHAEPVGELVDTDTALAVIWSAARRPVRRRNPVYSSLAAAAAVLVIAFAGVGLVAKQAHPGDQLWSVTKVLYSNYARSVETANVVRDELNEARAALEEKDPGKARASLQRVQQQLPVIRVNEGQTDLIARHRELEQMLQGSPAKKVPAGPSPSPFPRQLLETTPSPPSSGPASGEPSPTPGSSPTATPPNGPPPGMRPTGPASGNRPGVPLPPRSSPEDPSATDPPGTDPGSGPDGSPRPGPTYPGASRPYPSMSQFCDRPGPKPRHCGG